LPDYQSGEGHLLYARSLEAVRRLQGALAEYHALSVLLRGPSAVRYGVLLARMGRDAESKAVVDRRAQAAAPLARPSPQGAGRVIALAERAAADLIWTRHSRPGAGTIKPFRPPISLYIGGKSFRE